MGGMPVTATWDQDSFRWYTDAGGEGTNPIENTNVNPTTLGSGTQYRLRYLIQETNNSNQSETPVFELEYRVDPAGGTSFGSWLPIDSDDTYFTAVSSASVTDGGTTTQQIGAGTFNDGEFSYVDATARAPTNAMAATGGLDEYECEWVLNFASAAIGANFEFRVTRDTGNTMDTTTRTTQVLLADTVDDLLANDVESASEVSSPAVGQEHELLADDVQSTSEVSAPALSEIVDLLANDVETTSEVSAPTLQHIHVLLADDVQSTSEVTAPALVDVPGGPGEDTLLADDVESRSVLTRPTLNRRTRAGPSFSISKFLSIGSKFLMRRIRIKRKRLKARNSKLIRIRNGRRMR